MSVARVKFSLVSRAHYGCTGYYFFSTALGQLDSRGETALQTVCGEETSEARADVY